MYVSPLGALKSDGRFGGNMSIIRLGGSAQQLCGSVKEYGYFQTCRKELCFVISDVGDTYAAVKQFTVIHLMCCLKH